MTENNIDPLNIKELLSQDEYRIPIYQRNYDWGETESLQLLEDIADYAAMKKDKMYYIGSIVVFARSKGQNEYYEIIDGQQRLTTLTILMNVLSSLEEINQSMVWFKRANFSYEHRKEGDEAIRLLSQGRFSDHPSTASLSEVYQILKKNLTNILKSKKINLNDFVDYLLSNVIIMRIPLPRDTELNHYFEIMNSRGEQLEKHEVLKAILMEHLEEDKYSLCLFNDIWEACADMSTYVQMKIKPKLRSLLFSDNWTNLSSDNFDDVLKKYCHINDEDDSNNNESNEDEYISRSLSDLFTDADNNVEYELPNSDKSLEGGNDRFGSIINFSNFLLQVLKVMYHRKEDDYKTDIDAEIRLDDKRLIDIFQIVLQNSSDRRAFVKRYIITLLTIRNLFDSYIIKRENYNGKEGWSLKAPKKYGSKINYIGTFSGADFEDEISRDIKMLEAMFHVSAPTQIYKHWLNAILYYLYTKKIDQKKIDQKEIDQKGIDQKEMRTKLYTLACTYMLDRYLCEEKIDFETIIYENNFEASNNTIHWDFIDNGCNVENFIFNFYDYLTWKQDPNKYTNFEFTYRTSVEHFYPQHALEGHPQLDATTGLNDFGNLCLISRGINSKFSNNMPKAKLDNFGRGNGVDELSLKLNEMMDIVRQTQQWSTPEIYDFEKKARTRILDGIVKGSINANIKEV